MLLPIGILAAMNYYKQGHLNVFYGIVIALAFVVGGYLGSKISLGTGELMLRRLFGILLLVMAIRMMMK
jgi:uncharacterized membrane protein YfcA